MTNFHKILGKIYMDALRRYYPHVYNTTLQEFQDNAFDEKDLKNSLIITLGGDGTFVSASSFIKSRSTCILGINSDPSNSEGFLLGLELKSLRDRVGRIVMKEFGEDWRTHKDSGWQLDQHVYYEQQANILSSE